MNIKHINLYLIIGIILNLVLCGAFQSNIFTKNPSIEKRSILNLDNSLIYNTISSEKSITWGGVEYDSVTDLAIDSLDNVYLSGHSTYYENGSSNSFGNLIKFNRFGIEQWNYSWTGNRSNYFYSLGVDSSDNVYLGGITNNFYKEYNESTGVKKEDIILIKFNNLGTQLWNKTWGGNCSEYCFDIKIDQSDNIYLLAVSEISEENRTCFLLKFNDIGIMQCSQMLISNTSINYVKVSLDHLGNIYVAGNIYDTESGDIDICIAKYDPFGTELWFCIWGNDTSKEWFADMILNSQGSVYILSNLEKEGNYDICLIEFSSSGEYRLNHIWGGVEYDEGSSLALDSFENIYIAGTTYSFITGYYGYPDICLLKYDINGNLKWNRTYGDNQIEMCHALGLSSDNNNIYIAGEKYFFGRPDCDVLLIIIPNKVLTLIPIYILILVFFIPALCLIVLILVLNKFRK
ncbi:MAG: SBBP repeat-containing protein [Promethearchaeota archaeon]